jgi:hypothetical protein
MVRTIFHLPPTARRGENFGMTGDSRPWVMGLACLVSIVLAIVCVVTLRGWQIGLILAVIAFVLLVLKSAIRPRNGATRVRLAAIFLSATIVSALLVGSLYKHVLITIFYRLVAWLGVDIQPISEADLPWWQVASFLAFAVVVVLIVFFFTRDGLLPPPSRGSGKNRRFPSISRQQLAQVTENLARHLDQLNHQMDWSDGRFVELEAELEENNEVGIRRRVPRVVDSLRRTRGREIVLILGEPGTGKSVALRKLARLLLHRAGKTGNLPVYVNLREWPCPDSWTTESLPATQEVAASLWNWIKNQIDHRAGGPAASFGEKYGDALLKSGQIFFVLDSFDEISALLDLPKESALVERIADGIKKLLCGETNARGVIASRYDRSPARWLGANRWFELRPLDEGRVEQLMLRHFEGNGEVKRWLKAHPRSSMLPRNPFEVFLIAEHLEKEPRGADGYPSFPLNRVAAYESCFIRRLIKAEEWLTRHKSKSVISRNDLKGALLALAETLYVGRKGFEVAIRDLPDPLGGFFGPEVVRSLVEARLLRSGDGPDRTISFVHSRFGEALAAQALIRHPEWVDFEDIPTVGRWRDVLIVYFEIAPLESVKQIARRCFDEIAVLSDDGVHASNPLWIRGVRCLRFLDEACRYRRGAVSGFSGELTDLLERSLDPMPKWRHGDFDPLTAKLLLEGLALAEDRRISHLLAKALSHDHATIKDTAVWACRYLVGPESSFVEQLRNRQIRSASLKLIEPEWKFLRQFKEDPSLRPLSRLYVARFADNLLWLLGILVFTTARGSPALLFFGPLWLDDTTHLIRNRLHPLLQEVIRIGILFMRWGVSVVGVVVTLLALVFDMEPAFPLGLMFCASILIAPLSYWLVEPERYLSKLASFACSEMEKMRKGMHFLRKAPAKVRIGIGAGICVIAGMFYVFSRLEALFPIIGGFTLLIFALAVVYTIARHLFLDFLRYRKIVWWQGVPDRNWIEQNWKKLHSVYWRNRLVDRLQGLREVSGTWSEMPPYSANDSASRRLMKLDERWLGLER